MSPRPSPFPTPIPSAPGSQAISRRRLLAGAASVGAGLALSGCRGLNPPTGRQPFSPPISDLILRENQRPGTRDWMLTRTQIDPPTRYRCPWIEGYCSRTSVRAGESLDFCVSTNPASPFGIEIFRLGYYGGNGGRHLKSLGPFPGVTQPDPAVGTKRVRDCQWERCATLRIPRDWVSGVYVGKLTAERGGGQSYVIFIVRDDRRADFLFQCSDTTWAAYNRWPKQFSLYDDGRKEWYWGPRVRVSFNRPYGKYCQILDAPHSTGSDEFFLWEFPLAYWMEAEGCDVTYLSNLDTHADGAGLRRAKGFLSVGHDEYWSSEMFENVRQAIDAGVNVAFLSGNACYGRIEFSPDARGRGLRAFERVDIFGPRQPEEVKSFPEMEGFPFTSPHANSLMGAHSTSPVTGGADWICVRPDHWLFAGTGMKSGEGIPGLVGWEWHGDPAAVSGLEIVATGATQSAPGKLNDGTYTATVYSGPRHNVVFNASTCWWADGLSEPPGYVRPSVYTSPQGPDPRAQRITRNLLDRMRASAWPA
ncbi:MAG: N,N-dimethylformamidase beta subunit family domain-containing protein [Limisphaerales bacterium]